MKGLLYLALFFLFLACDFPRDPNNSYNNAKTGNLLVGVSINPPFVEKEGAVYFGKEIDLINRFAHNENLSVKFIEGAESELIKKLEAYEIHLMIGGFEKQTLWQEKAGLSIPYDKKHVILVAKGENKLLQRLETLLLMKYKKKG